MKSILVSILVALLFISMMTSLLLIGNQVFERQNQLLKVILKVRNEVMLGAMQSKEIVFSGNQEKQKSVIMHLENAGRYLKSILNDEENSELKIFPLADRKLDQEIHGLSKKMDKLSALTRTRFEKYGMSAETPETVDLLGSSLDSFNKKLNQVEKKIVDKFNQDKTTFSQIGFIFILISLLGASFISFFLYKSRVREIKQSLQSSKMNEELKLTNKELEKKVQYDSLTNLPNRELFIHLLDAAISLARRKKQWVIVFFIDLDKFKSINDYLGHNAGDNLLKNVALRLRESVRGEDVVARLAGDEFAVMLSAESSHESALETAHQVAKKMNEVLVSPFNVGKFETYISASIGIALYPQDGMESLTLMNNADTSMYDVKNTGKNDYRFFSPELNEETQNRLQLEQDLYQAISNGQMELYYQPQWSFETGELFGVEVLLRWNHPIKGIILPGSFIHIAESCGLVNDLDSWVLISTCKQLAKWEEQGFAPSQVSINVSANQFAKPGLVNQMASVLEKYQVNPHKIELEITEEILMQNPEYSSATLSALKQLGIKSAIDDFGTGHLSLAFLSKFPVDTLTLNRLFIKNVGIENSANSIAESLIKLAHKLDMNIVAEGIETEEQNDFLAAQNCNYAQGYLFNRPVNRNDIEVLLRFNKEKSVGESK